VLLNGFVAVQRFGDVLLPFLDKASEMKRLKVGILTFALLIPGVSITARELKCHSPNRQFRRSS